MNRNGLKLSREKQIISKDEEVGGKMEFIIMQQININNARYVIVVETKRDSLAILPGLVRVNQCRGGGV